jgi:subtilisin family serine protease
MKRFAALGFAAAIMAACSDNPSSPSATTTLAISPANRSSGPLGTPIPGHYIVVFENNGLSVASMAASIAAQHQSTIEHTYSTALRGVALPLTAAEANAMRADPNVAFVEQDQVVTLTSVTETNAPWGIDRTDQRALPLNATYVANADGTGVTAYMIDSGINYANPEFGGRAVMGIDLITAGGTATDCHGHGTGTASLVGGARYGVAKNIRLVAVRVSDCNGSAIQTSTVLAAVDWVTANRVLPAVANMSLIVPASSALNLAVANSIASGVVYAVAAGNNTDDACQYSPASAPGAITVGATNSVDSFASWSSFGSCVAINAPGENITMAWCCTNTSTKTSSGTSFATPHVAGTAALYLQAHPTATTTQVRSALLANATVNTLTSVPANTPNLLNYSGFISVATPPVAKFTSSCTTLTCSVDASGSTAQSSATYGWTFGDGSSGSGKTASHPYAAPGTYTVKLTVTDANGTSSTTKVVTAAAANQPPVARFTVTCPTLACTFDASTSSDDIGVVSYNWTWGDGRSETHVGAITRNGYAVAGTYSVTLKVTDGSGQTNSVTKAVQVPTSATNTAPTASITSPSNNATVAQGTSVAFAGTGSDPEDGSLGGSSLTWTSSRDGQIGTGTSVATSSLSVGTHVITLTARDAQGLTGTATRTITITGTPVNQAPVARFTWTCGAAGTRHCSFNASGSTDDVAVVSYTWDWGNGQSETHVGSSAGNTWAVSGTYTVTLTVKDGSGLTGTVTHTVAVP